MVVFNHQHNHGLSMNGEKANAFSVRRKWIILFILAGLNLPILPAITRWLSRSIATSRTYDGFSFDAQIDSNEMPKMKRITKSENRTELIPIYNYKRPPHAPAWPKVAWLMSFPNSGTSYTSKLVRRATQTASATNFGAANLGADGMNSIPLFDWSPVGPFLTDPKEVTSLKLTLPNENSYVITKTHCGGTCFGCIPKSYIQTQAEFQDDCLIGDYKKNGVKQKAMYDPSIITKAIHLIRDPFDNIVSRFHLKRNAVVHQGDSEWLEEYPNTRKGFRNFCNNYANVRHVRREKQYPVNGTDGSNVFWKYHNIPCYADFVRYILWHNHAIQTIQNLGLDSMTLHYESYSIGHNRTTNRILNFLGLNFTYKPEEFQRGKGYRDHFKPDEIAAVKSLAEEISDDETWELLERYF